MTPELVLIPDSVYGAALLSVIDFVLSFVVIAFIGFALALFPHLNRTGRVLQATPVAVSIMPARDENAEHAVVIAVAIYTMLGARRLFILARRGHLQAGPLNSARACTRRMLLVSSPIDDIAVPIRRQAVRIC